MIKIDNYQLHIIILKRNIFHFQKYLLMQADTGEENLLNVHTELKYAFITEKTVDECKNEYFVSHVLRKELKKNSPKQYFGIAGYKEGNLAGYLWFASGTKTSNVICSDKIAVIHHVYVSPEYRGKGYALQLMSAMAAELRKRGYKRMMIQVRPDNNSAIQAYRKCGFSNCRFTVLVMIGPFAVIRPVLK